VKLTELRWVFVFAAAFALNAALHLPFGGRILIPAVVANVLQIALGTWLAARWKMRTAK
jgi:predicted Na+-dependent transporter